MEVESDSLTNWYNSIRVYWKWPCLKNTSTYLLKECVTKTFLLMTFQTYIPLSDQTTNEICFLHIKIPLDAIILTPPTHPVTNFANQYKTQKLLSSKMQAALHIYFKSYTSKNWNCKKNHASDYYFHFSNVSRKAVFSSCDKITKFQKNVFSTTIIG